MFATIPPGSTLALVLLAICLLLVIAFEVSNGFHDAANAVATVIYTNSLKPTVAVIWSGVSAVIKRAGSLQEGVDWSQIVKAQDAPADWGGLDHDPAGHDPDIRAAVRPAVVAATLVAQAVPATSTLSAT